MLPTNVMGISLILSYLWALGHYASTNSQESILSFQRSNAALISGWSNDHCNQQHSKVAHVLRGGGIDSVEQNSRTSDDRKESKVTDSSKSQVIQIYENEYFDTKRKEWIGGSPLISQSPSDSISYDSSPNTNSYKQLPRWTAMTTDGNNVIAMVPPSEIIAPSGYNFTSDWKIDLAGDVRDEFGWEYFMEYATGGSDIDMHTSTSNGNSIAIGRRRRRWLRQVDRIDVNEREPLHGINSNNSTSTAQAKKSRKHKTSFQPQPSFIQPGRKAQLKRPKMPADLAESNPILKALISSFNFQGYGVTIIKSLIHSSSCGISWRLPLTPHFSFFDSRPYLPYVSTSLGLYYPQFNGACYLNASVCTEWIKNVLLSIIDWLKWSCNVLMLFTIGFWNTYIKNYYQKLQQQYMLSKALSKDAQGPFSERSKSHSYDGESNTVREDRYVQRHQVRKSVLSMPSLPKRRITVYSSDVSERIGFSCSWHYTVDSGFEFRTSWWYLYLPTVQYMMLVIASTLDKTNSFYQSYQMNKRQATLNRHRRQKIQVSEESLERVDEANREPITLSSLNKHRIMSWMRQKTGSLGISCSKIERLEPPFHSCSALLSLSGFYYYPKQTIRQLSNIISVATQAVSTRLVLFDAGRSFGNTSVDASSHPSAVFHVVGTKKDSRSVNDDGTSSTNISQKISSSKVNLRLDDDDADSSETSIVSPQVVDVKVGA